MSRDIIPMNPLAKHLESVPNDLFWTAEPPKPITKAQYSCYLLGKHAEENKNYVLFSKLWPGLFKTQRKAKLYLDAHKEIRRRKPSKQRLEVHAGDWFRCLAKQAGKTDPTPEEIAAYVEGCEQRKAEIDRQRRVK